MSRADQDFERPIFIVSAPRSGSRLVFDTLTQARGLCTIGGESHRLVETIAELNIGAHNLDSNRLLAEHATPQVVQELRQRILSSLRDRDGAPPTRRPVRLLEKMPKNALRIPFLTAAFPEAHFLVVLRDPREEISLMLDAWRSGRARTYERLPGWHLPAWSLVLTPGWRALAHKPLPEIVVSQWEACVRTMLDDLDALPYERWTLIRYDQFTQNWGSAVEQLCRRLQLDWDRPLTGPLPRIRDTVSGPDPAIAPLLARIQPTIDRAASFGRF